MLRLYWCIVFLLPIQVTAQDSLQTQHQSELFVKWNPLSLIGLESMLQMASEYRMTDESAVQVQIGYGPPFLDRFSLLKQGSLNERRAWQLRAEYRQYRRRQSQKGRYWALEGFAMMVNGSKSVFVATFEGGRDASELFPVRKRVLGGYLKLGFQRAMGRHSRFFYDIYAGLGLLYNHTVADSVNGLRYIHPVGGLFDVYRPTRCLSPNATVGLKLTYRING